jgi:hypothetical protein
VIDVTTTITAANGQLVVKREQDVSGYLEQNKRELAEAPSWRPYAGMNMRKVASIPMIVVEQWMKEGVNVLDPSPEAQRKVAQKLNSNEYQHLRTYPGQVGWKA